jgi:hypothetical protein
MPQKSPAFCSCACPRLTAEQEQQHSPVRKATQQHQTCEERRQRQELGQPIAREERYYKMNKGLDRLDPVRNTPLQALPKVHAHGASVLMTSCQPFVNTCTPCSWLYMYGRSTCRCLVVFTTAAVLS